MTSASNPSINYKGIILDKSLIEQYGLNFSDVQSKPSLADALIEVVSKTTKQCLWCNRSMTGRTGRSRRGHFIDCRKKHAE